MRILLLFYTQESSNFTRDFSPLVPEWERAPFLQIPERALRFGHSTEILRGLGKIPLRRLCREEIWSFIHLCYMKDDFSLASIGGFCNELFLKILSLSFEKKLQAYRTFRGCVKSANIPKFPGKRLNAKNLGGSRKEPY